MSAPFYRKPKGFTGIRVPSSGLSTVIESQQQMLESVETILENEDEMSIADIEDEMAEATMQDMEVALEEDFDPDREDLEVGNAVTANEEDIISGRISWEIQEKLLNSLIDLCVKSRTRTNYKRLFTLMVAYVKKRVSSSNRMELDGQVGESEVQLESPQTETLPQTMAEITVPAFTTLNQMSNTAPTSVPRVISHQAPPTCHTVEEVYHTFGNYVKYCKSCISNGSKWTGSLRALYTQKRAIYTVCKYVYGGNTTAMQMDFQRQLPEAKPSIEKLREWSSQIYKKLIQNNTMEEQIKTDPLLETIGVRALKKSKVPLYGRLLPNYK